MTKKIFIAIAIMVGLTLEIGIIKVTYELYKEGKRWDSPYHGLTTNNPDRFYPDALNGLLDQIYFNIEDQDFRQELFEKVKTLKNIMPEKVSEPDEMNKFDILLEEITMAVIPKVSFNRDSYDNIYTTAYKARLFHASRKPEIKIATKKLDQLFKTRKPTNDQWIKEMNILMKSVLGTEGYQILKKKALIHQLLNKPTYRSHDNRGYIKKEIENAKDDTLKTILKAWYKKNMRNVWNNDFYVQFEGFKTIQQIYNYQIPKLPPQKQNLYIQKLIALQPGDTKTLLQIQAEVLQEIEEQKLPSL